MANFHQLLKETVSESSTTVSKLSEYTGIERTKLIRIMKGERDINQEELNTILTAINATPDEKERLQLELDYYNLGEKTNNLIETIFGLISHFSSKTALDIPPCPKLDLDEKGIKTVRGINSVMAVMQAIVAEEFDCEPDEDRIPLIYTNLNSENKQMYDYLTSVVIKHNGPINFKVLMHLCSCSEYDAKNLRALFEWVPSAKVSCEIFYTYGFSAMNSPVVMFDYKYYLATSSTLIFVSADFNKLLLITDKETVEDFLNSFERQLRESRSLAKLSDTPLELMESMSSPALRKHFAKKALLLQYQPCLLPYCPKSFFFKYISDSLPIKEQLAADGYRYYSTVKKSGTICTENGLAEFVETGFFKEIPKSFMSPLNIQDRLFLLEQLREDVVNGKDAFFILRDDYIIPELSFMGSDSAVSIFWACDKANSFSGSVSINAVDPILARPLIEFMENLPKSRYAYSRAYSISILDKYIKSLRDVL